MYDSSCLNARNSWNSHRLLIKAPFKQGLKIWQRGKPSVWDANVIMEKENQSVWGGPSSEYSEFEEELALETSMSQLVS